MAVTRKEEDRALNVDEREVVRQTRHPEIQALSDDALDKLSRRLRDMRDKAQSQANQHRREMRGKSAPKGASPKTSDAGSRLKASVLSIGMKRLNAESQRRTAMAKNHSLVENAQRALALKQAAQKGNVPFNTRHANEGMRDIPDQKAISLVRPAERGRLRKAQAVAQAKRDGAQA
jgi:hypothetical protein